jgi:hypothetical protein
LHQLASQRDAAKFYHADVPLNNVKVGLLEQSITASDVNAALDALGALAALR